MSVRFMTMSRCLFGCTKFLSAQWERERGREVGGKAQTGKRHLSGNEMARNILNAFNYVWSPVSVHTS